MNELDRMRKLAGILTEGVMPVPGVGQPSNEIDEMFDKLSEELDPSEESLIHRYMAGEITREEFMQEMDSMAATDHSMRQGEMGMQGDDTPQGNRAWGREQNDWNDAMDGWDGEDDEEIDETAPMDEKAPPGMEDMVMKLKKQYPGHEEKAFATAWSIYNKKHGKADESGPGMEECSTPMMEGGLDLEIQSAIEMLKDLEHNGYGPEEIVSTIEQSFRDDGFSDEDIAGVMTAVQQHIEGGDSGEEDDGECPTCHGTGEGMYDGASCSNCGGSGQLSGGDPDDFNEPDPDEYDPADDIYEETEEESVDEEQVDEAFDLNNGYDDITFMKPGDFFPDGADSPVTSRTGPSGARMGDNPEQKKMEVAEAHKELVYNYRTFLKESAKK